MRVAILGAMVDLLLHIGHHKTGTTTVQRALNVNRERLAESGILYPKTGLRGEAHHLLAEVKWKADHEGAETLFESLRDEVERAEPRLVVLSSEQFYHRKGLRPSLSALRRIFETVDVIAFLRRQDEYLEASYAQKLKRGLMEEDEAAYLRWALESGRMDHGTHIARWHGARGVDSLAVHATEEGNRVDALAVLLEYLGEFPELDPTPRLNVRLSRHAVELMRLLKHEYGDIPSPGRTIEVLTAWSADRDEPASWNHFWSAGQRTDFLRSFDESNDRAAATLGRVKPLFTGVPSDDGEPYPGLPGGVIDELVVLLNDHGVEVDRQRI